MIAFKPVENEFQPFLGAGYNPHQIACIEAFEFEIYSKAANRLFNIQ